VWPIEISARKMRALGVALALGSLLGHVAALVFFEDGGSVTLLADKKAVVAEVIVRRAC
jgi:hypothetical protein